MHAALYQLRTAGTTEASSGRTAPTPHAASTPLPTMLVPLSCQGGAPDEKSFSLSLAAALSGSVQLEQYPKSLILLSVLVLQAITFSHSLSHIHTIAATLAATMIADSESLSYLVLVLSTA